MATSRREALRTVLQLSTIAAIGLTTRASFADHYFVPSGSMEPTVLTGDHIFVNKAAYGLRLPLSDAWMLRYDAPARGDVVVFTVGQGPGSAEGETGDVLLKRVVAVAGDLVEVRDGHVSIDGHPANEPTLRLEDGDGGPDFGPVRVPEGKLLVLGDNRGNSRDGRVFGFVDRTRILGRAVAVIARDHRPTFAPL